MVKLLIAFGKFRLAVKIDCRVILALLMYFSQ